MGTLVVAPGSNLNNLPELLEAINATNAPVQHLTGVVTGREFLKEIGTKKYRRLHYAGHGTRGGLTLSDGEVRGEELEDAVRTSGLELVILNSCESVFIANDLHDMGVPFTVGWVGGEQDDEAYSEFGKVFWRSYASGNDYKSAFQSAHDVIVKFYDDTVPPMFINGSSAALRVQMNALVSQMMDAKKEKAPNRRIEIMFAITVAIMILLSLLVVSFMLFSNGG